MEYSAIYIHNICTKKCIYSLLSYSLEYRPKNDEIIETNLHCAFEPAFLEEKVVEQGLYAEN